MSTPVSARPKVASGRALRGPDAAVAAVILAAVLLGWLTAAGQVEVITATAAPLDR